MQVHVIVTDMGADQRYYIVNADLYTPDEAVRQVDFQDSCAYNTTYIDTITLDKNLTVKRIDQ